MKIFIVVLLSLINILCAQTSDSLKIKKWAIGITGSPDYCNQISSGSKMQMGYVKSEAKAKLGLTAGVNVLYIVSQRIAVEAAALFSSKGIFVHTPSWATSGGTYDPTIPNSGLSTIEFEKQSMYTYQYLEIPLKMNYYVLNNKFKMFPSIGISANVFLGKKTSTNVLDNAEIRKTQISHSYNNKNIPALDAALIIGLGLSYELNKSLFLKFEPSYRQFIRKMVDYPVNGYLYSFGMNAGIYIRF
ncbi:MAG: PorT family protein [Burkholderiales bacterium]|nr:PorT family protein [Bacteroidia bacterium]